MLVRYRNLHLHLHLHLDEMCLEIVRLESMMKLRLREESVSVIE